MPFKLIGTILLVVLVAVLTGFNLSNKCTIWFFHSFVNIPVFAMLITSFIAGVIVTLPFTIGRRKVEKQLDKVKEELEEKKAQLEEKFSEIKTNSSDQQEPVSTTTDEVVDDAEKKKKSTKAKQPKAGKKK